MYCVLTVIAVRRYLRVSRFAAPHPSPPISVLKPLAGVDEGLDLNLRSFFEQGLSRL